MTRVTITDDVVAQLRDVLDAEEVDDPVNWMGVQGVALRMGHEELVDFIVEADATTYREALVRARERREASGGDGDADAGAGDAPD